MDVESIALEFRGAGLGDKRRSERLERIGLELARDPGLSFPEAMGSEGQLEGLYRFLNNDEVTFEAVHAHREGDNYDLFARLHARDCQYVIRLAHNRHVIGESDKLKQVVARASCLFRREVRVAPRAPQLPRDRKIHATRHAREATLEVAAMTVELRRSTNFTTA